MRHFFEQDEELTGIGIGTAIGHRKNASSCVPSQEIFVFKLLAVDRIAPCAILANDIATLGHEHRDHSMKLAALIVKSFAL